MFGDGLFKPLALPIRPKDHAGKPAVNANGPDGGSPGPLGLKFRDARLDQ